MIDYRIPSGYSEHPEVEPLYQNDEQTLFDWKTIKSLCISTAPDHPAYEMGIDEYQKKRGYFNDGDEESTHPVRLPFRVDPFIASALPILGKRYNIGTYRYVAMLLELGMITFQKDYHDEYSGISAVTKNMFNEVLDVKTENAFLQIQKQTICLYTSSRTNKLFAPSIPNWIASTIKEYALVLNICNSDMTNVCLYLGFSHDQNAMKHIRLTQKKDALIFKFEEELMYLSKRSTDISLFLTPHHSNNET